jgi:hypothetical protein
VFGSFKRSSPKSPGLSFICSIRGASTTFEKFSGSSIIDFILLCCAILQEI